MSLTEAFQLQPFIKKIGSINRIDLKGTDTKINGVYYYQLDQTSLADAKTTLKEQLNLPIDETTDSITSEAADDSFTPSN